MAEQTPTRRSGRGRIPNKRYEDEGIETLNQVLSSDSEDDAVLQNIQEEVSDGDDEFKSGANVSVESVSDDMSAGDGSHSSAVQTPEEERDSALSHVETPVIKISNDRPGLDQAVARPFQTPVLKVESRSRGTTDVGLSKSSRLPTLGGPAQDDQAPVLQSMGQWGNEPTLPSRSRMRFPFVHTEQMRHRESTEGWKWYHDQGGKMVFNDRQRLVTSDVQAATESLPDAQAKGHDVLLGPYDQQDFIRIDSLDAINVARFWRRTDPYSDDAGTSQPRNHRTGWILNAGGRIRTLAWAPNHTGDQQYLALATQTQVSPKRGIAPSFQPDDPFPSNIQIWRFPVHTQGPPAINLTGESNGASLMLDLRNQWGDAKQLKWCPMPRDLGVGEPEDTIYIGLLAGVFDDGHIRILDLRIDAGASKSTTYYDIKSPAATIIPLEKTICSCLYWLSQTDIAVGHSNGYLCIYSIDPNHRSVLPVTNTPKTQPTEPSRSASPGLTLKPLEPWLTSRIHQSYITSIAQAYPNLPAIVASTSVSGHTRLTSLDRPSVSYVLSRRSHMPPVTIAYHPALYGCIFPEDSREMISYSGLRFWGNNVQIGEATGSGGVMALDTGTCHTSIAWGGADGRVMVTNPLRKVFKGTEKVWQICVFQHDWVRKPELKSAAVGGVAEGDAVAQMAHRPTQHEPLPAGKRGNARITEGYKVQEADVERNPSGRSLVTGVGRHGKGNLTLTIYEEETGVTAIAWNPNVACGGWLAAGWGSGLVRIEDVAI